MRKYALNIIWGSDSNDFKKWMVMIILYVYFVQNGTRPNKEKWMKVGQEKSKHNILSF